MTRFPILERHFSFLEHLFLFRTSFFAPSRFVPWDGTGQAVKILYHPIPGFERLPWPVTAFGKVLSLFLYPGTIKERLSLCPKKLHSS